MIKCFCDICGKEFKDCDEVESFKVKKIWHSWHEPGWEKWEKLEVHEECWKKICEVVAKSKEEPIVSEIKG